MTGECFLDKNIVINATTEAGKQGVFNFSVCASIVAASVGCKVVHILTEDEFDDFSNNFQFLEALGVRLCSSELEAEKQFLCNDICFVDAKCFEDLPLVKEVFFGSVRFQNKDKFIARLVEKKTRRALVASFDDGFVRGINICADTPVFEINNEEIEKYTISPEKLGLKRVEKLSLRGATPRYNANLASDVLCGKIRDAKLDITVLNAGAMVYLSGLSKDYIGGVMKAYSCVSKGVSCKRLGSLQNTDFS